MDATPSTALVDQQKFAELFAAAWTVDECYRVSAQAEINRVVGRFSTVEHIVAHAGIHPSFPDDREELEREILLLLKGFVAVPDMEDMPEIAEAKNDPEHVLTIVVGILISIIDPRKGERD